MAERDIRKEVTDRIIESLNQGVMPWRRPWRDADRAAGLPTNAITGRPYNGGNRLILLSEAQSMGYGDNRWLTYRQAQAAGGHVAKGEKGTLIEYWDQIPFWRRKDVSLERYGSKVELAREPDREAKTVDLKGVGEVDKSELSVLHDGSRYSWKHAEKQLSLLVSKAHVVFNVQQCRDLDIADAKAVSVGPDYAKAEYIIRGMMADGVRYAHGGNIAAYNMLADRVTMPDPRQFDTREAYLGTLMHELGHATGHPKRNNRQLMNDFGSVDYAKEELIAELTSAFVSAETGIGFADEGHASYIDSWLEVLGKDKHEVFRAAKAASRAADYLLEKGRELELSEQQKGKGKRREVELER